jgi:hypothetical protein
VPLLERVADADGDAVCEGVPVSEDVPLDDAVVEDNAVVELEGLPHSKTSEPAGKGKKSKKEEEDDATKLRGSRPVTVNSAVMTNADDEVE